ncbi:NlpC/P60 family protein [Butyrivibrio fibrisolvens]|uniref:NlpC/P60 family protein n=1 Tax=Butyrivibrio fibrisolvens TaxID=831 RepID=A0A1H9VI71_BUTFI|nr:C40 family peptidase [Butyrivibrio fibrisolvens]SES21268.1 NlpC/P60 family protein [Butyrivibrio fibrisolvens]
MEKEYKSESNKSKAIKMMQLSGEVVGNVATKEISDVSGERKGSDNSGTGVEESSLKTKDRILDNLEKYEHLKATGLYLADKHENNKKASKRIKASRRETRKALNDTKLGEKASKRHPLTDSEKKILSNSKERMKRYNKAVKKEERFIARTKNSNDFEKNQAKKRKKLEHLESLEQMTNYGDGDGQGTGLEENFQDNLEGTVTWASRRTHDAVKDIDYELKSHLEHKKDSKQTTKRGNEARPKEETRSKHEGRISKRQAKQFEEKQLTKEEKHNLQKKSLKKRRNKVIFKNDKLSGATAKIKEAVGSKGAKAALLGIAGPILAIVGVILILFLILAAISGMSGEMHEYTSYQAEDETLLLSNKVVVEEEKADKTAIKDTETNHPTASDGGGFNEYQYSLDGELTTKDALIAKIKHDGNLIASYLTAKYGDYKLTDAIKAELKKIYEEAFTLSQYETIEQRTSTYYDSEAEITYYWNGSSWQSTACTYRYAIFHTDLNTKPLDDVLKAHLATEEQKRFYDLYKSTSGQKDYLFGGYTARDDIYRYQYEPEEYEAIYGKADISFSDAEAQQIYNVAQTQLGRPYHWGGSTLASGFDCSGYVYWVMNTSGVASFPRTSANVMLNTYCDPVTAAEAKPGDLVFFQGTYATVGASHVGIYLGNNQMIHCGDPIKITNITTNYWTSHFYTFARIKDKYR